MAKGKHVYGRSGKLIRAKVVSRKTKERIYKSIIRPTVMYGSETWVLNGSEERGRGLGEMGKKYPGGYMVYTGAWSRPRVEKKNL